MVVDRRYKTLKAASRACQSTFMAAAAAEADLSTLAMGGLAEKMVVVVVAATSLAMALAVASLVVVVVGLTAGAVPGLGFP